MFPTIVILRIFCCGALLYCIKSIHLLLLLLQHPDFVGGTFSNFVHQFKISNLKFKISHVSS